MLAASATAPGQTGYCLVVRYEYDAFGHLARVRHNSEAGLVYWEATTADAVGRVLNEVFGNGVVTNHVFDPQTGALTDIETSNASLSVQQSLHYTWDAAGNLESRHDGLQGLTETFTYDALDRLDTVTLSGSVVNGLILDMAYDAAGNITTKTGTGTYSYNGTRPHALTNLAKTGGGSATFSYDANGNFLTGNGKSAEWTSYNYPSRTVAGTASVRFAYGPDRQRYKEQQYSGSTLLSERITVNGYFERVDENGVITHKHNIRAGSKVVAIHDRRSDYLHETNYLHRDHLGSVDVITDEDGAVVSRTSFDAFGLRRNGGNWSTGFPAPAVIAEARAVTNRGYTGHAMLDTVKLIHMNGRVYDPELGRFLSPDPNIPSPHNSQAYNRYSYVYNNPLRYTDPSGFVAYQAWSPVMTRGWDFGFSGQSFADGKKPLYRYRICNGRNDKHCHDDVDCAGY